MNRRILNAAAAGCLALLCGACQTTPEEAAELGGVLEGTPVQFVPGVARAGLQFVDGQYPLLFSPESYAIWNLPGAAPADPLGAPTPPPAPAGIAQVQLHLVSAFADMSIAYDSVGLRGINIYLLTPSGQKIRPAQTMVGQNFNESPRGALREFSRTNTLLFPTGGLTYIAPPPGAPAPGLKLVLEGYQSTFAFEWPSVIPMTVSQNKFSDRPGVQKTRSGLDNAHKKFRAISHKFD